jgi:hypothetical protein
MTEVLYCLCIDMWWANEQFFFVSTHGQKNYSLYQMKSFLSTQTIKGGVQVLEVPWLWHTSEMHSFFY